jgi:hypothetical protein
MNKFNWKKLAGHFSLEHHLSLLVLCLLACLFLLIYLVENELTAYIALMFIVFLVAIAVSWKNIKKIRNDKKVELTTVFVSKKLYKEVFLLILLGSMLLLNIELSNAIKKLDLSQYAVFVPYLSFAAFCVKKWWMRFVFVTLTFIVGLLLSVLNT